MVSLNTRIRVAIVEDHELVLDALYKLAEQTCEVVGTARTGPDAVQLAEKTQPAIMLLDISLPEMNGLEAARQIKRVAPATRLIFVTFHKSLAYAREAFEAGGSGYVLKQAPSADLLAAIEAVAQGRLFLSPMLQPPEWKDESAPGRPSLFFRALSPRQCEILGLVAAGKAAKEIAADLHLSVKTVEFHKKNLMLALNIRSSAGLIRHAVEQELVSPSDFLRLRVLAGEKSSG